MAESAASRDEAQALVSQAFEAESEAEARECLDRALAADPHNVDALLMQAGFQPDLALRTEELKKAVEVSADGPDRARFRALYAYGGVLLMTGRAAECLATYEEILRLDDQDKIGVRYELVSLYLTADRLGDAKRIESRFGADQGAFLEWARALLYYGRGEYRTAREHLRQAREANPFVEDRLGDPSSEPAPPDGLHTPGDENEADWILFHQGIAWLLNPLAVGWLSGELDPDHPDYAGPLNEIGASIGGARDE